MISYLENSNKFNFRVGGIILSKDKSKVLLHRLSNFNFWLLPGGRVEMMENTEESLIREMEEEIGIKCSINKLALSSETFFKLKEISYHEIAFYYILNPEDAEILQKEEFCGIEGEKYIFKWFAIDELKNLDLRPDCIKEYLQDSKKEYKHIIKNDLNA
ncbi:MAG: NUDIX domain-containing protein [Clostridia bacterium]